MKKSLFFIMIFTLVTVVSGCANNDAAARDTGRYLKDTTDDIDGSSGETGSKDGEEVAPQLVLTDEIYLFSYECGYFSWDQKPGRAPLLIENNAQLEFAKERYGLDYPDDYNEEDYWFYDSSFIEYFREMESNYPLEEYSYLIQYAEVSSGGYYLHADRVIIDGNKIYFGMDDASRSPVEGEMVPDVMGGFMHMAAIPKEYTEDTVFDNVVYLDKDDLEQCLDFQILSYSILQVRS